jgi:NADH:ubiquinone oxidoreductase subunit 1 (chain H)
MDFWMRLIALIVQCVIIALAATTAFAYLTLFERRTLARLQNRIGPNRAGPNGVLQPLADAVKLFFKEDIIPALADRPVYLIAPAISIIPALIIWAVIPLGCWNVLGSYKACFDPAQQNDANSFWNIFIVANNINIGVLYLLAVTSIGVYGITLAGWASNSKYSMLGGIRSAAQLVSYELSLGLAVLGAIMMAGSLNTTEIVDVQRGWWFVIPQFLGFVLFMISSTAEVVRAPFDLVEAEQELAGGYNTEYGSMKFALFFMSEYLKLIAVSAIAVMLYFGGWNFPGLEALGDTLSPMIGVAGASAVVGIVSFLVFVLKVLIFLFISVWVRASWPRLRYDHLMNLGWKWLLPMALINVVATAAVVVLVPDNRYIQGIILFVIGVVVIVGAAALGQPRNKHQVEPISMAQISTKQ